MGTCMGTWGTFGGPHTGFTAGPDSKRRARPLDRDSTRAAPNTYDVKCNSALTRRRRVHRALNTQNTPRADLSYGAISGPRAYTVRAAPVDSAEELRALGSLASITAAPWTSSHTRARLAQGVRRILACIRWPSGVVLSMHPAARVTPAARTAHFASYGRRQAPGQSRRSQGCRRSRPRG